MDATKDMVNIFNTGKLNVNEGLLDDFKNLLSKTPASATIDTNPTNKENKNNSVQSTMTNQIHPLSLCTLMFFKIVNYSYKGNITWK